jgi:mycothiol synthase
MDVPDGYRFRAPTDDDVVGVADLLQVDDPDEDGEATLGEDFVRTAWTGSGFDRDTDAWSVVDRSDALVAYGQVTPDEPDMIESWGVVHPEHRGRGVGSALLERIDARASERLRGTPAGRFRHAVNGGDRAAADLLRARGLRPLRHFWHMQIDLEGHVDPGPAPEGIEIREVNPRDDLPAVHAILEEAFVDDPSRFHTPPPFERWVEEEVGSPSFDPSLWLLAREAETPAGVLTASAGDERGWIDFLAVDARFRGRGIASALLRRAFALFADRAFPRVLVSVDAENITGATGVYERVGMRTVKRWDLWERAEGDASATPGP